MTLSSGRCLVVCAYLKDRLLARATFIPLSDFDGVLLIIDIKLAKCVDVTILVFTSNKIF